MLPRTLCPGETGQPCALVRLGSAVDMRSLITTYLYGLTDRLTASSSQDHHSSSDQPLRYQDQQ